MSQTYVLVGLEKDKKTYINFKIWGEGRSMTYFKLFHTKWKFVLVMYPFYVLYTTTAHSINTIFQHNHTLLKFTFVEYKYSSSQKILHLNRSGMSLSFSYRNIHPNVNNTIICIGSKHFSCHINLKFGSYWTQQFILLSSND